MIPWIFTHSPLEHWLPDYRRTFDAWEDGGVRGIVFGYLQFMQDDGTTIRTFAPDPEVYKSFEVDPPPEALRDLEKEKQLYAMLDDAASRDWYIMTFSVPDGGGTRPLEEGPYGAVRISLPSRRGIA